MKLASIAAIAVPLVLLAACGSNEQKTGPQGGKDMQMSRNETQSAQKDQPKSDPAWERTAPVDVAAIDRDRDGFVYQDQMHWNVLADEPGKCPLCGMTLVKTSVDDAKTNLRENGFDVK